MIHATPLISTIVAGIGLAFLFGTLAAWLRFPPLVGYLIAGIVVGPHTPGFVADPALASELAELGVILLMFGVGLHFSLKDLLSVSSIAIPGAIVQIGAATALGLGLAVLLGWSVPAGMVFGLALSVASTVVLLKALQERREINTRRGQIAVGWLIVEDLAMVLALVLLPALASAINGPGAAGVVGGHDWIAERFDLGLTGTLLLTFAKVAAFVAFMLVVGRRVIPWMLHIVAHMGSREMFRLAVLAIALTVAFGAAKLFGVSLALGAFFAGMVLSESELSHQAAQESLPLRDAFAVLFFVSVGMLFDPSILWREPLPLLGVLFIILIGKSLAAFLIVLAFGHPLRTALTISASLAQIGEFSFILAELGVKLDLMPESAQSFILAGAILSILMNPVMFALVDWVLRRTAQPVPAAVPAAPEPAPELLHTTALENHAVLAGYGRVGALVGQELRDRGVPLVVIEDADKPVAQLTEGGMEVVVGNAAKPEVLKAANVVHARFLILAIPNAFEAGQVVQQARTANPSLRIIARAHADVEVEHLTALGADVVIMGEREIAHGITESLFATPPAAPAAAEERALPAPEERKPEAPAA
ncbi:CPA2 family monovalent cation:H+ antiporter-2 [Azospirillum fermentarium]|uniref:YbaL family putative K(+) efflux transporter n=1 Tax=Azospirillum fermentarium TaxID=1233114 RepID=UPI0022276D6C|nr:YbaL family putative K(+) efflux transporter [Azospirillum fermentarium]MCW2247898.1 CPA2 family monovalent cation:H+ antiporter-2 [Azospirillum fermentarium]